MPASYKINIIISSSLLIVALLMTLLAWSIKFKKQVSFIAGYDEKTCKDKDGLANHVGGALFVTGMVCTILAISTFIVPAHAKLIVGFYVISMALGTVIAAVGGNKYIK